MALKPDCGLALLFCEALGVEQTDVKRVCDESERLAEESCRQSPLGLPDVDIGRNFMIELLALCSFNFRPLKHLSVYTTSKVGGSDQSLLLCHFLSQLCSSLLRLFRMASAKSAELPSVEEVHKPCLVAFVLLRNQVCGNQVCGNHV